MGRVLFASFLGALAAASPAAAAVVEVTSTLPEWLAPEGRLVVTGWAAPSERVTLRSQSGALARVWAGSRGGSRLKGHVTETGPNRLSLVAGGIETPLGVVPVRPLRLAAVGDVTFGNGVGRMIRLYGKHRYPWVSVAPVLRRADIALREDLEGAVSTRGTPVPDKEFHFRGPPGALAAARRFAGVDVVSLANNHHASTTGGSPSSTRSATRAATESARSEAGPTSSAPAAQHSYPSAASRSPSSATPT